MGDDDLDEKILDETDTSDTEIGDPADLGDEDVAENEVYDDGNEVTDRPASGIVPVPPVPA